jgi:putative metallohydrolase (TIGR04338 family)
MRDSQRKKVYTAEVEAFDHDKKTDDPTFREVKAVEKFVKKVFSMKRVQKEWPKTNWLPRVKDGRGCRNAIAHGSGAISIPVWARREWVILHELAHIITARHYYGAAGHGWEFCKTYLRLVEIVMGKEAFLALEKSFLKHGVKFIQPKVEKLDFTFQL